ncbi:MAG TPA: stress responsive protein [Dysgonomonas sp.]|nr:stress responsive protein [Dysgonomonas sp.]
MIKHIVCWKLKEEAHGNDKATNMKLIKEKLENLQGKIEGLIKIEAGINLPDYPANYDVVLYSELESKEALDYYQSHPLHQEILPFIREAVSSRVAVDYEA